MWRALYRLYRIVSWLEHWILRRFTSAGLRLLSALIIAAMLGVDTSNLVAYEVFALLACVITMAVVFSWFFRAKFAATRLLPRFGTAGQAMSYRVVVQNLTGHDQEGLTLLENPADPRPSFREWRAMQRAAEKLVRSFRFNESRRAGSLRMASIKAASVAAIPPRGSVEVRMELTPLRRGLLRLEKVTLARPDPFGLFRSLVNVPAPQTALILPKRYPIPPLALSGTMRYQQGGVALASSVGRSEEFVGLRDYRRGDPLRHIHWRSWARAGRPIVKEFEDEFFVRHALVLDTFTELPNSELFEEAVSVAASFACTVRTQESLLDLLFVGPEAFCFTAGRGLGREDQMLEILASVRNCPDKPFRSLEHLVLGHVGAVSGCICVLLDWDRERQEFVKKIRALDVPMMVLVLVPEGNAETLDPGPLRDSPDKFRALEMGRVKEGLAKL